MDKIERGEQNLSKENHSSFLRLCNKNIKYIGVIGVFLLLVIVVIITSIQSQQKVKVRTKAAERSNASPFSSAPNGSFAPSPNGSHDGADSPNCHLWGWVCDGSNFALPVTAHIYVNDNNGDPNSYQWVDSVVAGNARPDLNGGGFPCGTDPKTNQRHGFDYFLPSNNPFRDNKPHKYYVFGIDIDDRGNTGGTNTALYQTGKTMICEPIEPSIPPTNTPRPRQSETPTPSPTVPPPTGLMPTGTTACGLTSLTFKWNFNISIPSYALRIDDTANGWTGTCSTVNDGDTCQTVTAGSFQRSVIPGHSYTWWVHSIDISGRWSDPVGASVTVPICPFNICSSCGYSDTQNVCVKNTCPLNTSCVAQQVSCGNNPNCYQKQCVR